MRKLILATVIATTCTMWTSCSYANLSLAFNEPSSTVTVSSTVTEQAQPTVEQATPATEQATPRATEGRAATVAKSPSRPRSHFSSRPVIIRAAYQHCH
jgi:hypothetical protein